MNTVEQGVTVYTSAKRTKDRMPEIARAARLFAQASGHGKLLEERANELQTDHSGMDRHEAIVSALTMYGSAGTA